jgi:outer membrane immunogenic protein
MKCRALALALSILATPTLAADQSLSPNRVFSWTGFYLGLNAGYAAVKTKHELLFDDAVIGTLDSKMQGAFGGGQAGLNLQSGAFVWGIEGDVQAGAIKGRESFAGTCAAIICGSDIDVAATVESKVPWFATLRLRGGVAQDNWLFFVTGGGIYGVSEHKSLVTIDTETMAGTEKQKDWGWTAGLGIENAVNQNVSWKLEYLYANFGTNDRVIDGDGVLSKTDAHLVRFGVNIRN